MFCGSCGTENANGAKFCKGCGKPLENSKNQEIKKTETPTGNTGSANTGSTNTAPVAQGVDITKTIDKVKAIPKKLIIGVVAAIVVLIAVIGVTKNISKTINLNDYIVLDMGGYDGYGMAAARIDWDSMEKKYGSKMSFTGLARKEYAGMLGMVTPIDIVKDGVKVEIEKYEDLTNGDVITYKWNINKDILKCINCKFKYKDGDFKVSGLTEVGTFDAFADLTVEFTGIAPNGSANLNYTGKDMYFYDFQCDRTSDLSNGDVVEVTIDSSKLEYYAEKLGKVPAELSKKYTVSGLLSYVTELSEIDNTALTTMQHQATDVFYAHVAQDWDQSETLENFTYIGNYLLTSKKVTGDFWGTYNYIFLVYKAQVRNIHSNGNKQYNKLNDVYWYIRFNSLMVDEAGNVSVDITNYNTPSNSFVISSNIAKSWWSEKDWHYYGYETVNKLYADAVTSNIDSFNHEDNVDESLAPETVQEENESSSEDGYVLNNSDTERLNKEDLDGLSAQDCKIARNEIYARHGRKFKDRELQEHFDSCDWYEGRIEPDDFKETELSEIEIANKDLIVEYEKEKGYR